MLIIFLFEDNAWYQMNVFLFKCIENKKLYSFMK